MVPERPALFNILPVGRVRLTPAGLYSSAGAALPEPLRVSAIR
jgi:hypothetical protein